MIRGKIAAIAVLCASMTLTCKSTAPGPEERDEALTEGTRTRSWGTPEEQGMEVEKGVAGRGTAVPLGEGSAGEEERKVLVMTDADWRQACDQSLSWAELTSVLNKRGLHLTVVHSTCCGWTLRDRSARGEGLPRYLA
jgi:hypothetical protein